VPKSTTAARLNITQFADLIGLTRPAVTLMTREDGAPFDRGAGGWLMPNALHWYIRREKTRSKSTKPADLTEAKLRQENAAAEMAELKLAEQRNELMTVAEFERVLTDACYRVAARLDNLPTRLAAAVVGVKTKAEALRVIERLVDEARSELFAGDDIEDPEESEEDAA
jgi:terminase small subunit / prophage DNA-packing protein